MQNKLNPYKRVTFPKGEKIRTKLKYFRNRIVRKKMNIDEFGRYNGGLPKNLPSNIGQNRGSSANIPGSFATRQDV